MIETGGINEQDFASIKKLIIGAHELSMVAINMSTMIGELQAISQDSLSQLETLDNLYLPSKSTSE